MISRKNILVIILSLTAGGLLTWWLYQRFHILFLVIFIPLISIGAPLFRRLLTHEKESPLNDE
ncbi:MAG: hypothetical protein AMS17_16190 [Spirochaetes bacterium DG_61]|nr:MAG: hypothetical protein AMS17_16190 [Spirochaetes bacterium DG_61]